MPEQVRLTKPLLKLNQGLNTEANEIQFPDGFTTDERNYELLLDGGRRRRKGLAQEEGGSDKTTTEDATGDYNSSFVWYNVGGDPNKTFIVHKFGSTLYFTDDAETISTTYHTSTIDLDNYNSGTGTMDTASADFTSGRGYLLVSGEFMDPIVVEYNASGNSFSVCRLEITIRDFKGIDDGVPIGVEPTTLDDDHRYNLLNRGWSDDEIDAFETALSKYPNKTMVWHVGYRKQTDASYADEDGIKLFDPAKLDGEPILNTSAPQGSMLIRPEDSTEGTKLGFSANPITNATYARSGNTLTITLTTANAHGLSVSDAFTASGYSFIVNFPPGIPATWPLSGSQTVVTVPSATSLTFQVVEDAFNQSGIGFSTNNLGSLSGDPITRSGGSVLDINVSTVEFHDGRVFYAGLNDQEWSDYLFFSQIPDSIDKFNRCYQEADPTDPNNNQLVTTDGGYVVLQGIQGVKKLLSVRSSLLIFATNGVWEVAGGQRGFFTPDGYSVRKITDVGCNSPLSPIAIENSAMYTSVDGIYQISPNQYTGVLEAASISEDLIQTRWNSLTNAEMERVQTEYDASNKRLWFLYGKTTGTGTNSAAFYYDKALILDLRIPSWTYYEYNSDQFSGIINMFAITNTDEAEAANKMKFSCAVTDATTVRTCDHDQTDFLDYDGAESPLPYMVTGHDNIGDFQLRKQAPIITVYAKRTETGYTSTGGGWEPVNESSNLMTAYWDWTDDAVSNKIGQQQQTYRHQRAFVPSAADDVDGYPVVVTRNKVRGRGRVLQLRFDGEAGKDSYLMGFTVNYRASQRI